jgi:beta-glucosidase
MFSKKRVPLWRGLTALTLSSLAFSAIGLGIARTWRSTVDSALGTKSYITNTSDAKYVSSYKTGDEVMAASKALAIREGAEGTVIMKNENAVLPLSKTQTVALWGSSAYNPYMSAAKNSDQVKLAAALTTAGFTVNTTLKAIYDELGTHTTTVGSGWFQSTTYDYGPNTSAGDYDENGYQIVEADPDTDFVGVGKASSDWKDKAKSDVAIVVFSRPGGEGTTYRPGIARDKNGNTLKQNPLAFSPEELKVLKYAKETAGKVVVLLNTSCTMEIDPLVKGDYAVDGIAYIGIPNDYQFTGIVQVLDGDVNATGALADTYAVDSASAPAMMNFGGDYYSDSETAGAGGTTGYDDPRYPGETIVNAAQGSFGGGSNSYNGGMYIAEAEGIYTGYKYYETRYFDGVAGEGNALSAPGAYEDSTWNYAKEVDYPFGYGLSYLSYEETLESIDVDKKVGGLVTAKINVKNTDKKDGKFLAQLYFSAPYTDYDKTNKVEKSAVNFLTSEKVDVKAGATETVTLQIPTKYLASYDYTTAKTYILDQGTYYFSTGNGSHAVTNNILSAMNKTGDAQGTTTQVKTWENGALDTTTFAVSDSGAKITNVEEQADLNYYLPGTVKYLTRSDWSGTYPVNYNTVNGGKGVSIAASSKKDEWMKNMRGETYTIQTGNPAKEAANNGVTFQDITYDQQTNIKDGYWDKLASEITIDQAVGAVAHGGSQSDVLDNVNNPIVVQNDGPNGFNSKALSTNNGESAAKDPYYVDKDTEAGKFVTAINSETLMGSAFSPLLAYDWGKLLGNDGLWIGNYQIWGAALNYHRSPYNGRNTEYPSEDPMLCNIIGVGITKGTKEFGIISGPKHIGFNDQEHNRGGISVFLNEQKFRETDLRGFQGAVEEGKATGLMVAFNRLGAINASHDTAMLVKMIRGEWNFQGLISTDMMSNSYYFNAENCIMATITQIADFAGSNSTISGGKTGGDATWSYLSVDAVKNDSVLVEQARQDLKYQLYAFANSAILNISTTKVTPAWETGLISLVIVNAVLATAFLALTVVYSVAGKKEEK